MNVKVYNQSGKETGEMALPAALATPWNADLVHQVVTGEMANQRQSVAHAKGRSEVRGGGRKPWRQKGTGRARHGSIRSPIWKGGGVTHGPTKERVFAKKINTKMARKALATVLSAKIRDGEVLVLDELKLAQPKTKEAAMVFQNLSKIKTFSDLMGKSKRALVLLPDASQEARRALRNLPFIELEEARNVTAHEALNRKYVVLPRASVDVLAKRLGA
ncbi:MAG: 50S ribosomal protein L4, partial [Patescibacteria group bacterium]